MRTLLILVFCLFSIAVISQNAKKVLIIGIDGCRPDALTVANTPNIDLLISNGVYSPDALNDDITISGPGWSANICGVWSDKHLVTNNNFDGNNYEQYPPFIAYVEDFDNSLETASICHWGPINDFIIDDHADFKLNVSTDAQVSSEAVDYLSQNSSDVLFLHFDDVDIAGHSFGFSPSVSQYINAIEEVDDFIGPILEAIENRPDYNEEDWLILVTTDHGGINNSHGGNSIEEQDVFFIASGNSIDTQVIEKEIILIDPPVNCLDDPLELQFDGDNDFVTVDQNALFDFGSDQDFTIECRVRTQTGGDVSIVGNKDWSTGLNPGFVLSFALPQGEQWKVNIGDGNNRVDINTGGIIVDNEWHTLSVSFDRDGLMKMYLDGQFVSEANIASIGNINTGEGLRFGADINNAFDFNGAIAEVRVWDTLLNDTSINTWHCTRLDNSHPNYNNLIGYWKLDEESGTVAADSSIHGNDGTINDALWGTPSLETYDYSNTPRITDIPYTALTHLCIPISPDWELDGQSWIPICDILGQPTNSLRINVQLLPNPVKDHIRVIIDNVEDYNNLILEVYSISGKNIHSQEIITDETTVKLTQLPVGIYFLRIKNNTGSIVKKFIKSF